MKHSITIRYEDYIITGDYYPETPDVMYLRNGDPGYPGDPSEFHPKIFRNKKGRFSSGPFSKNEWTVVDDLMLDEMCLLADAEYGRQMEEEEKAILAVLDETEKFNDVNGIINMLANKEFSPGFDPNGE